MLELIEHFHVNLMQASQDDTSYQLSTMHKRSISYFLINTVSAKTDAAFQL